MLSNTLEDNGLNDENITKKFSTLSKELLDKKELVAYAVSKNAFLFYYASLRLKDDIEIVEQAIQSNPMAIQYATERIRND